jgi:hypothetical protein
VDVSTSDGFDAAIAALLTFLEAPLTTTIGQLEHQLADQAGDDVRSIVESHGIGADLLSAALIARERLGRINDIIHAAAIAIVLPHLLEPDELLRRPSLAATVAIVGAPKCAGRRRRRTAAFDPGRSSEPTIAFGFDPASRLRSLPRSRGRGGASRRGSRSGCGGDRLAWRSARAAPATSAIQTSLLPP